MARSSELLRTSGRRSKTPSPTAGSRPVNENSSHGSTLVVGLTIAFGAGGATLPISDGALERTMVVELCVLLSLSLALWLRGRSAERNSGAVLVAVSILGLAGIAISPFERSAESQPIATGADRDSSPPGSSLAVESVAFEDVYLGVAVSRQVIDVSADDILGMVDSSGARNSGDGEWYREHGGTALEVGMATILLRNMTAVDLTVTDITARAQCAPPEHQTYVSLITGGAGNAVAAIGLDLEATQSRAVEMDFRDGPELTERTYFVEHSLKIGSREQVTVKVFLQALSLSCEADLQVHYTGQDGSEVIAIDNGGKPFAVTGIAPERTPGKPYSGYDSLYVQTLGALGWKREDPAEFGETRGTDGKK